MEHRERLGICKTCINRKVVLNVGIHCGLTNEIPNFENSCSFYEGDEVILREKKIADENYKSALVGKKKLKRILSFLIVIVAIQVILSFLSLRIFDLEYGLKLCLGTSVKLFILYMVYTGKEWAKYLLTILILFSVITSIGVMMASISKSSSAIMMVFVLVAYAYIAYILIADGDVKNWMKHQRLKY